MAPIRLTHPGNATRGVQPRLYPYWPCINNHRGRADLFVVLGRVGEPAFILRVDKATGQAAGMRNLPPFATGEGCYFSDTDPDRLFLIDGPRLLTFNASTGDLGLVFTLEPKHGARLWQAHSSRDGQTHSATARDANDQALGAIVSRHGAQHFFASPGMDECQVTGNGRWLFIQEGRANRVVDLELGGQQTISQEEGALGHMDVGEDFAIGEDDSGDRWQMTRWDLRDGTPRKTVILIGPAAWGDGLGHLAVRGNLVVHSSNADGQLWRLAADGQGAPVAIGPGGLATLPGMTQDEKYDRQLRGVPDPIGEWVVWVSNSGDPRGRFDAFLAPVGGGDLGGHPDPKPPHRPPQTGGPTVPGSQPYPDENSWWTAFLEEIEALYLEAGQRIDVQAFKWSARTAYDIGKGEDKQQAKVKHLRELRAALGL